MFFGCTIANCVTETTAKTVAINPTRSGDADVLKIFSPDQAVVPMAVTKVFVGIEFIGLGIIVSILSITTRFGCEDRRARSGIERYVALQVDRETRVGTLVKHDGARASRIE